MSRYDFPLGLCAALLLAGTAQGQSFNAPGTAERLKWGTVNVLLASDTSRGLQVRAATSIFWSGTHKQFSATLDPDKVSGWLDRANLIVTTKSKPATATAVLMDSISSLDGGMLAVVRKSDGDRWSTRVFLVLRDHTGAEPWAVDAGLTDMSDFIKATFRQAAISTYRPMPVAGGTPFLFPSSEAPPSRPSCPGLKYPREMELNREQGEVWTQYVVGLDGAVEAGTIKILLSDDSSFTRSAISTISACKFSPGILDGRAVRVLVSQHLVFKLGR